MELGSIFKDEDVWGDFGGIFGLWPQPPKHLPLRILGLSGAPWPDEIRKAYREKLFMAHPDLRPAFENPEYQEIAQKGRGDLPDIQELVWARDCALRQAPKPKPVTTNGGDKMERTANVTSTVKREYFDREPGEPRVCRLCGKEIEPKRLARIYGDQTVFCDECAEKDKEEYKKKGWRDWNNFHQRCGNCGVWTMAGYRSSRYCSWECQRQADAARRRQYRELRRSNRICAECGNRFTPRRADGKYCSPACRQRAYRKRLRSRER